MIKVDTESQQGELLIDGDPEEVCMEMLATIVMFYQGLRGMDKKTAETFRNIVETNMGEVFRMKFNNVEMFKI